MTALVVIGVIAALSWVLWLLWTAQNVERDWDRFVRDNRCIRLSSTEGNSRPGWRCADGKIHYRWRQQL